MSCFPINSARYKKENGTSFYKQRKNIEFTANEKISCVFRIKI